MRHDRLPVFVALLATSLALASSPPAKADQPAGPQTSSVQLHLPYHVPLDRGGLIVVQKGYARYKITQFDENGKLLRQAKGQSMGLAGGGAVTLKSRYVGHDIQLSGATTSTPQHAGMKKQVFSGEGSYSLKNGGYVKAEQRYGQKRLSEYAPDGTLLGKADATHPLIGLKQGGVAFTRKTYTSFEVILYETAPSATQPTATNNGTNCETSGDSAAVNQLGNVINAASTQATP